MTLPQVLLVCLVHTLDKALVQSSLTIQSATQPTTPPSSPALMLRTRLGYTTVTMWRMPPSYALVRGGGVVIKYGALTVYSKQDIECCFLNCAKFD